MMMARLYDLAAMKRIFPTVVVLFAVAVLCAAACLYRLPSGSGSNVPHSPLVGLKLIVEAEREFMRNDRDGNGLREYWVGEVAGLRTLRDARGVPLRLIEASIAHRDASSVGVDGGRRRFSTLPAEADGSMRRWKYAVIPTRWNGAPYGMDLDNDGRNCESEVGFAFCAYPEIYGEATRHTWIVNETGRIWKKDLAGHPAGQFPANPETEGWILATEP
jgi:hypothetical protein